MPIRLLCFKELGSKLQITLVERGTMYTEIEPILEAAICKSFPPHLPIEPSFHPGYKDIESDKYAIERLILLCSKYAILSHTWLHGISAEITYSDWNKREFNPDQPGYKKLANFCRTAWKDYRVTFGWMDTVCINKESSTELDESIRSMYKWYRNAHVCITYLADTVTLSDMHMDSWFTRGWTLQELIAPSYIKFYTTDWNRLGSSSKTQSDKNDSIILGQIQKATTITGYELKYSIRWLSISRRMQMAAKRQVTREEDSAYSLMGLFDVSIATAYGEGAKRAFFRLIQEILNSSQDGVVDIFDWAGSHGPPISRLLPSTLEDYLCCVSTQGTDPEHFASPQKLVTTTKPIEPLLLTHLGLRITIILMPVLSMENPTRQCKPIGNYYATLTVTISSLDIFGFYSWVEESYSVLDARLSNTLNVRPDSSLKALGILNIGVKSDMIMVPKFCLAVGLADDDTKITTKRPIVFTLDKRRSRDGNEPAEYNAWSRDTNFHYIKRSELERHGMKLVTMHL